ncbi:hypothetical protein FKM82_020842 [Ascaphus truei]
MQEECWVRSGGRWYWYGPEQERGVITWHGYSISIARRKGYRLAYRRRKPERECCRGVEFTPIPGPLIKLLYYKNVHQDPD